ncbi:hypothetical protein [Variovorax sp. J31P207]|uniref:hypothetical protein n=1 Tax=Variovorax sp. J31P207 TaxID=3053510 RepID=UPI00257687FD|nr:hypothetical protein [Variovorax sp. J31P207]MDM0068974.1 hypothetical protein [Variovorax sp. J31P207]
MTPFSIRWVYNRLPPLSDEDIARVKQLYFENAGKRWGYVLKGWPTRVDGMPLQLPGNRPFTEIEIQVNFEYFSQDKNAVARVPGATMQRLKPSTNQPWNFPFLAALNIDLNDLTSLLMDRARFFDTIVHEVGHVLGIGTRWNDAVPTPPLVRNIAGRYRYVGPHACQAYAGLMGWSYTGSPPGIPLDPEQTGTTSAYHWGEVELPFEMMSSTLDTPTVATLAGGGGSNIISKVSVGALQDLGYVVDMLAAEPLPVGFTPPAPPPLPWP